MPCLCQWWMAAYMSEEEEEKSVVVSYILSVLFFLAWPDWPQYLKLFMYWFDLTLAIFFPVCSIVMSHYSSTNNACVQVNGFTGVCLVSFFVVNGIASIPCGITLQLYQHPVGSVLGYLLENLLLALGKNFRTCQYHCCKKHLPGNVCNWRMANNGGINPTWHIALISMANMGSINPTYSNAMEEAHNILYYHPYQTRTCSYDWTAYMVALS